MPTLWFSYSTVEGLDALEPTRSPYARTWHLGRYLRTRAAEIGYDFQYVNLDDTTPRTFQRDDIALGHLWFNEPSFIQQAFDADIKAKLIIQPYSHKMVGDEALPVLHKYFDLADHLLLITGPYWWDTMPEAHWQAKATRLDNSINPAIHPFAKRKWNKPGQRAGLCIGYSNPIKGLDKAAELAQVAGFRLGHLGGADVEIFRHVPQFVNLGGAIFTPDVIQRLCDAWDFLVCMPRYDANPTVLHELSAWGLIAFTTKEGGYWPNQPFAELRLDDLPFNLEAIDWMQAAPALGLQAHAERLRTIVTADKYSWRHLCETVWGKVCEYLA